MSPTLPLISFAAPTSFDSTGSGSTAVLDAPAGRLRDSFGRVLTDLRVSVTDRCNYKCVYCRTGNEGAQYTELPIASYLRMIRSFVALGIEKIRLSGGEPLARRDLAELVAAARAAGLYSNLITSALGVDRKRLLDLLHAHNEEEQPRDEVA